MHYMRWFRARPATACDVPGCDSPAYAHGWCAMHYQRWRKFGDPSGEATRSTPVERITENARREGECLVWQGALTKDGYGRIRDGKRMVRVHRAIWERDHGPIPDGAEVDHTCWNRACVESAHLRLSDRQQNVANRRGANRTSRTGSRNVHYDRERRAYVAQVGRKKIGRFATSEEARAAAERARKNAYGDFAGGS